MSNFREDPGAALRKSVFGATRDYFKADVAGNVKSIASYTATGAVAGGAVGGPYGAAAGAAVGLLSAQIKISVQRLTKLNNIAKRLSSQTLKLVKIMSSWHPAIANLEGDVRRARNKVRYAWGKEVAPILKRWTKWSIQFETDWAEIKMRWFRILEPLLNTLTSILQWALKIPPAIARVTTSIFEFMQGLAQNPFIKYSSLSTFAFATVFPPVEKKESGSGAKIEHPEWFKEATLNIWEVLKAIDLNTAERGKGMENIRTGLWYPFWLQPEVPLMGGSARKFMQGMASTAREKRAKRKRLETEEEETVDTEKEAETTALNLHIHVRDNEDLAGRFHKAYQIAESAINKHSTSHALAILSANDVGGLV